MALSGLLCRKLNAHKDLEQYSSCLALCIATGAERLRHWGMAVPFAAASPAKLRTESSQPIWPRTAIHQLFGEHNRQRGCWIPAVKEWVHIERYLRFNRL